LEEQEGGANVAGELVAVAGGNGVVARVDQDLAELREAIEVALVDRIDLKAGS
jgi:hypothetical protein